MFCCKHVLSMTGKELGEGYNCGKLSQKCNMVSLGILNCILMETGTVQVFEKRGMIKQNNYIQHNRWEDILAHPRSIAMKKGLVVFYIFSKLDFKRISSLSACGIERKKHLLCHEQLEMWSSSGKDIRIWNKYCRNGIRNSVFDVY